MTPKGGYEAKAHAVLHEGMYSAVCLDGWPQKPMVMKDYTAGVCWRAARAMESSHA